MITSVDGVARNNTRHNIDNQHKKKRKKLTF